MVIKMFNTLIGHTYEITSFNSSENPDSLLRLMQYGFVEGAQIKVLRKAPLFKDPILVEIRGSQVVLGSEEANLINVKEIL